MASRQSTKIKRTKDDPVAKVAREIGLADTHLTHFTLVDVKNRSEADQRHMARSGVKHTVRRKSRVERLLAAKVIDPHQAKAIAWYADQHEAGYATVGCTANYAGAGGGGFGTSDLLARYGEQAEARDNYLWAKSFIPHDLVAGFEAVVLDQHGLNEVPTIGNSKRTRFRNRRAAFRMACDFLHIGIEKVTG